jgi:hypothetical protein
MNLPHVMMIVIPDNPISMYYRGRVESSWTDRGFNIEYYSAVTPETIKDQPRPLNFRIKDYPSPKRAREFTETEKAVWYSHRNIWGIIRRKKSPVIVIEHDTMLLKPIDPRIFNRVKAMGLCHSLLPDGTMGTTVGAGYYLTREAAEEFYRDTFDLRINFNSDNYIHKKIDKMGSHWRTHYCQQIKDTTIGTTIRHG